MKKVFRLASAEFNKIFYRPSIFILTALLIITLILTNIVYSPTQNTTKLSYSGNSVNAIYQEFYNTRNTINKASIDRQFDENYKNIKIQYNSIELSQETSLDTLISKIYQIDSGGSSAYSDLFDSIKDQQISSSQTNNIEPLSNALIELKDTSSKLLDYLATIKNNANEKPLNYFFTTSQYNTIYKEVERLYDAIPQNFDGYKTAKDYIDLANTIRQNYTLSSSRKIVANLEEFSIDYDTYDELIQKYYKDAKQTLINVYNTQIETFLNEHFESTNEEDIAQMNEYIAQYYSYADMNMTVLTNKFMLLRIGDKSDTELDSLIGYTEVSKYALNEQNTIYDYLLDNNNFQYNYLTSFNYGKASGATSNAYDYTVYSMQILSVLIIVFTIFYACSSIAGDQSSGTMKMIAIRPYTRNKVFTGKYLSCVMFGLMLIIISTVASFVVGAIMYGAPMSQCLVVFNSSSAITIHPILLLFVYLLSIFVNLLFYISLAMFICLLFKSNTLSVFLTTILYATQVVLSGLVGSAWLKYTPFGHFDLFKYFGNSKLGMFSMNILPDSDFLTSALVIGLMIVVFNSLAHLIFKRRDIT